MKMIESEEYLPDFQFCSGNRFWLIHYCPVKRDSNELPALIENPLLSLL
jgi:hypothetical protein